MFRKQSNQGIVPKTSSSVKRWARRGLICLSLFILILLIHYGLYFILRGPLPSNPKIIAHRGGQPENTIVGSLKSIEVGVDSIEADIHQTKDGQLVVIHDEALDRTTICRGQVKSLTREQIRSRCHIKNNHNEKVPTFEEFIKLAKDADVQLLIEVKSPHLYPGIEDKVVKTLIEADYIQETVIQSFDPDALVKIHSINPDAQVCPLYGLGGLDLSNPRPSKANYLCPMAEMVILNPWMIRQAHTEGREVYIWFGAIDQHPLVMHFLLALGADGLMVDDPEPLAKILAP